MRCKSKAKKIGVTVGGPVPNTNFTIKPNKDHYFFATANDPFYTGAYYILVPKLTALGERVAILKSRTRREGISCLME